MVILLKSGADANKFTPQGSTLLNECIAAGKTAAIKTILTHAKEIDVNLANSCNGKRPLVEACLKLAKPLETVRALLARKANPNLGNTSIEGNTESNELTALYALFSPDAAVKDSAEECLKTVQLLMEYKADPYPPCNKIQDKFFPTPLHKLVTIKIQHEALFWLIKHFPPSKELLTQRNIEGLTLAQLSCKNRLSLNILLTSQLDKITAEATASGSHL